ncbi:MAG: hypothetical protein A3H32_01740 [Betaproteobacteria bacterium RIFCSPLOWO2_02_FULL_63_19]|nr:MAG: hypothetical protein A3H32_01740 [Betaproteobacteria bacterium RIFCSPLOWO2_02_FULL_63_19]
MRAKSLVFICTQYRRAIFQSIMAAQLLSMGPAGYVAAMIVRLCMCSAGLCRGLVAERRADSLADLWSVGII